MKHATEPCRIGTRHGDSRIGASDGETTGSRRFDGGGNSGPQGLHIGFRSRSGPVGGPIAAGIDRKERNGTLAHAVRSGIRERKFQDIAVGGDRFGVIAGFDTGPEPGFQRLGRIEQGHLVAAGDILRNRNFELLLSTVADRQLRRPLLRRVVGLRPDAHTGSPLALNRIDGKPFGTALDRPSGIGRHRELQRGFRSPEMQRRGGRMQPNVALGGLLVRRTGRRQAEHRHTQQNTQQKSLHHSVH